MSTANTSENPYAAPQTPGIQEAGWQPGFARLVLALSILWLWQIPFGAAALSSELAVLWNIKIPSLPGLCIVLILHLGLSWFFTYWITQQNRPRTALTIVIPSTLAASTMLVAGTAVSFHGLRNEWPAYLAPLACIVSVGLTLTQFRAFSQGHRHWNQKQVKP